ncbi:SDR family oxidoreductase [Amycolatopsis taiwanensis]|uniref:SDR family oxidoreductase n=1 Tax=Amycolatopsis taiwanensis TaxID=342230 RepID=UPI0004879CDA|nr:NAD(P)H-binding protein [Amycolatopsis taiwanensis]
MTILVTGAGGNIGSCVVAKLANAGHPVRGTARDTTALRVPAGVEAVELDITRPRDVGQALSNVDAVFLYPVRGNADEFLASAREAGVQYVVLLSSPAAYESGEYDRPIGLAHRAMERSLENSGLPHTVLYPSWLATNARRDWGEQIRNTGRVGIAYPDAQVNPIHIDDVAEVAVRLLTEERHRGRMQVLTGPESLRLRDIVGLLGKALGKAIPVDELSHEQALAQRPSWMPEEILETLLDVTAAAVGVPAPVTNTVERVTGHASRAFTDWARAHRADFDPSESEHH